MSAAVSVNQMLEQAPLPQMIENMAKAIADAQFEIDKVMVKSLQMLADTIDNGVQLPGENNKRSMLELGFAPTFYHFSEVEFRARVAFSSTVSEESQVGGSAGIDYKIFSASINASYTNRYSFNAEGSSEVNTKIVAIPPPTELTEIINDLVQKKRIKP